MIKNYKKFRKHVKKERIKYLEKELRKYKKFSYRDSLTGLYNRRKLEDDITRYLELKNRFKISFVVMLLDIDNFKKVNDILGHKAGDKLLKKMARILRKSIRKYEKVYRISGDEFVIIFSYHRKTKTLEKRIKESLIKADIEASIGYNSLQEDILEIVDKKMYENKRRKK